MKRTAKPKPKPAGGTVTVAVVQAASVAFDRKRTLAKALDLTRDAAKQGAKLVLFPEAFIGRGDMSRGGLLLRCVRAREELTYVPVVGAVRHGPRPPKLAPIRGISKWR